MKTTIHNATELRQAVLALSQFEAGKQRDKIAGPAARAAIAMYAWTLDDAARGLEYNVAVIQIASEFELTPHQSKRAAKGFDFMPLTFSETGPRGKAGKAANMAVSRATAPLKASTLESATKYAERLTAPVVVTIASRRDKIVAAAKRFAAMTPAMQRDVLAMVKELNAAK